MRINEMEQQAGISKKNIRYYETEGLLTPGRNSENGYRDYTEADLRVLLQIKLLRKLSIPIAEIREMQTGVLTLSDGLRRHQITLEREAKNLRQITTLCTELLEQGHTLPALDPSESLTRMARLEQEGVSFVNIHKQDRKKQYVAPIISAAVFLGLLGWLLELYALRDNLIMFFLMVSEVN